MDLRQLEILQAIAETGSFTACGRKLHVSQSAISRQILLLEEELGEPLFLRVGRQVRMTPAAESLVQLGQRVFLDVRETLGTITDRTSSSTRSTLARPGNRSASRNSDSGRSGSTTATTFADVTFAPAAMTGALELDAAGAGTVAGRVPLSGRRHATTATTDSIERWTRLRAVGRIELLNGDERINT